MSGVPLIFTPRFGRFRAIALAGLLLVPPAIASAEDAVTVDISKDAIDLFFDRCIDSPSESDRALAQVHWSQLLSMNYDSERILELLEGLPAECGFISLKSAVMNLARAETQTESASRRSTPTKSSRPKRRLLGLGTNVGIGVGHQYTINASPKGGFDAHLDIELPGFELRIFPTDEFSIDINLQLGDMAWLAHKGGTSFFAMMTLAHFHLFSASAGSNSSVNFAIAPGFFFGARPASDDGMFGGGARIGVDFVDDDEVFGAGLYLRPLFYATSEYAGQRYENFELLLEFTVSVYIPTP